MTVSLLRDPTAAGPGPSVAALVFCGEEEEGEGAEEMEHDGGGRKGEGGGGNNKNATIIMSLSHEGLAAPGDTIPGAEYGGGDNEDGGGGGGLLRGHGTRAGGVDLVAAATAAAAATTTGTTAGDAAAAAPTTPASSGSRGLFATVAGPVSRVDRLVRVTPALPGARYAADVGDVVVGRVTEVSGKRWRVDLGGKHDAALALSAVSLPVAAGGGAGEEGGGEEEEEGGDATAAFSAAAASAAAVVARRRGAEDEASMREILTEGDLLSAEVQAVHSSDGSLLLHARSAKYGRLGATPGGQLVKLRASSVGRQRQQFNELRNCGVAVILGVNGWVWVSPLDVPKKQEAGSGGGESSAAALNKKLLDGRRAVAVASAALRALCSLGISVTPLSIERAVGVAARGNFAPSSSAAGGPEEEAYLLAVARAERAAR